MFDYFKNLDQVTTIFLTSFYFTIDEFVLDSSVLMHPILFSSDITSGKSVKSITLSIGCLKTVFQSVKFLAIRIKPLAQPEWFYNFELLYLKSQTFHLCF
jgi:hypothetical protein